MKILIAEDDFLSRKMLNRMLSEYGQCDYAVNGKEVIDAVKFALKSGKHYDLISLDIMMPGMDGHEALVGIRNMEIENGIEEGKGVRVLMVSALGDPKSVMQSFREGATGYIAKPITKAKLVVELKKLGFDV